MKVIYKATLSVTEFQRVHFPVANAQPLSLQIQHGKPQLWILGETNRVRRDTSVERRNLSETFLTIQMIGTGHVTDLPDTAVFIDTLQFDGGELVLHCFLRTDLEL